MERIMPLQGLIISDIDGTISFSGAPIEDSLIEYLSSLSDKGWGIIFATGRTKDWACHSLERCRFSHYVAVFNGASMWKRIPPHGKTDLFIEEKIYSHSVSKDCLEQIYSLTLPSEFGSLIYEGGEHERIFSSKRWLDPTIFDHVMRRKERQKEEWIWIDSIHDLPTNLSSVSSIRFFALEGDEKLQKLEAELSTIADKAGLALPCMRDSFNPKIRIIQVTHQAATKAAPIIALKGENVIPVIAIGDDYNDRPMLEIADYSIGIAGIEPSLASLCDGITEEANSGAVMNAIARAIETVSQMKGIS